MPYTIHTPTQTQRILAHLRKSPIDPLTALRKYGCFRLGARVWDLKQQGFDIRSRIVSEKGKKFARYLLVQ
jgi:hypothetical protein